MAKMVLVIGLGVPIVVLCCAMICCAGVMQLREEQNSPHHTAHERG